MMSQIALFWVGGISYVENVSHKDLSRLAIAILLVPTSPCIMRISTVYMWCHVILSRTFTYICKKIFQVKRSEKAV